MSSAESEAKFLIGVNLVRFGDKHVGGNEVYAREIVYGLLDQGWPLKLFCYSKESCVDRFGEAIRDLCVEVQGRSPMSAMQFGLRAACEREAVQLFFSPSHLLPLRTPKCPTVCTIHDLNFKHFSQGTLKDFYKSVFYSHTARNSDAIVVISKWTEGDVLKNYPQAKGKTHLVYNGASVNPSSGSTDFKGEPFMFGVGHHAHKHPEFLIDLLSRLKDDQPTLRVKICGLPAERKLELSERAMQRGIEDRCDLLGYVESDELSDLYKSASVMIFPSTFEGFGLPLIEAMSQSTPVIALGRTAIPEVVGEAGILMDELDVDDWAKEVRRLLTDQPFRDYLIAKGIERAEYFSWKRCVDNLVTVFRSVVQ